VAAASYNGNIQDCQKTKKELLKMEQNTAEIRNLPEIQVIAEYLRNMKFRRKLFGGCDEASVLDHIEKITLQYEAILSAHAAQREDDARELAELRARLARSEQENAAWNSYYRELVAWYDAMARQQAEPAQKKQADVPK